MNKEITLKILFLLLIATLLVPIFYILNPPFREYNPITAIRNKVHVETLEYVKNNIEGDEYVKYSLKNKKEYKEKVQHLSKLRNSGLESISLLRYRKDFESDGVWVYYGLLTGACKEILVPRTSLNKNILLNFLFHDLNNKKTLIRSSKISTPLYILKDGSDELVSLDIDKESHTAIPVIWLEEDLWYEILAYKSTLYKSKNNQQELRDAIKAIRSISSLAADSEIDVNNKIIADLLTSIENLL